MAHIPVNSSNIASVDYDGSNELEIKFKTGSTYRYVGVSPEIFNTFMDAPSKGRYLAAVIKVGCPCERLDKL